MEQMDTEQVLGYLRNASNFPPGNQFAIGYWLGRAMEYVEQNALDYDWFRAELKKRDFDEAIVPVPKISVSRG